MDNSDFTLSPADGSHLLSDSPLLLSSVSSFSNTGPGGDDLSLSELSITDRPSACSKPFTLLAEHHTQPGPTDDNDTQDQSENEDSILLPEQTAKADDKTKRQARERQREEKLRSDLFILKKLNSAFALFHDALEESGSANERVTAQLNQTDALLNKYIDFLSKSEEFSRLILDEQWFGGDADEELLERERREAREKARREAEERVLAERREREKREHEERERLEREEKERIERERQERLAARGGIRGVRGTRASTRGTRGMTRGGGVPPGTSVGSSTSRLRAPHASGTEALQTGSVKRYTSTKAVTTESSVRGTARQT
ncbi:hypothetical protein AX15_002802 [Amanita polypyramis BW_CC]|nr:hypothetical protein AX15_002802 [Amanita polypyramis BW_CC]